MDAYEVVKENYKVGFPKSRIDQFYQSVQYDIYSKVFCGEIPPSLMYKLWSWIMIKRYGTQWQGYERETFQRNNAVVHSDQAPLVT